MLAQRYSLILFYLFEFEQNVRNAVLTVYPEYPTGDKTKGDFSLFCLKHMV